jgi:hypothetical protein
MNSFGVPRFPAPAKEHLRRTGLHGSRDDLQIRPGRADKTAPREGHVAEDARPLPVEIDQIDRDWLTAAFRTYAPQAYVRGFEIVDVNHGTCTKIRLRLDMDEASRRDGIPETVILKGGFEPHSRSMGYMHEFEIAAYRDVLPELGLLTPKCWFADYDEARQQGIHIMEDLVARGATFCSALRPSTYEEAARRMDSMAEFHARTWDAPERLAAGRWSGLREYFETTRDSLTRFLEPEIWDPFIRSPRGAAASVRFHDRGWMREALERGAVFSSRLAAHSVLHGDTHPGNLYIDADGAPGYFDPLTCRGPGMSEVAYHLSCALDSADRANWERALVARYLAALGAHGVEPPDLDEAMRQYAISLARTYFIFVINDSVFQPESINTAYVARINAAMLQHDTIGLLEKVV